MQRVNRRRSAQVLPAPGAQREREAFAARVAQSTARRLR
jgi:hypothetical protein